MRLLSAKLQGYAMLESVIAVWIVGLACSGLIAIMVSAERIKARADKLQSAGIETQLAFVELAGSADLESLGRSFGAGSSISCTRQPVPQEGAPGSTFGLDRIVCDVHDPNGVRVLSNQKVVLTHRN